MLFWTRQAHPLGDVLAQLLLHEAPNFRAERVVGLVIEWRLEALIVPAAQQGSRDITVQPLSTRGSGRHGRWCYLARLTSAYYHTTAVGPPHCAAASSCNRTTETFNSALVYWLPLWRPWFRPLVEGRAPLAGRAAAAHLQSPSQTLVASARMFEEGRSRLCENAGGTKDPSTAFYSLVERCIRGASRNKRGLSAARPKELVQGPAA